MFMKIKTIISLIALAVLANTCFANNDHVLFANNDQSAYALQSEKLTGLRSEFFRYSDDYWAARGWHREPGNPRWERVGGNNSSNVRKHQEKPEVIKSTGFIKTQTAAEALFAAKMAERH